MEFKVDGADGRLDKFLAQKIKVASRTKLERAIQAGAVKVNNNFVLKPGFKLRAGDHIVVLDEKLIVSQRDFIPVPEADIPLQVIYEDPDILVINKPAGLLTHPTPKQPNHTLVNALLGRYPKTAGVGENRSRPGIVHRLDKNTSGLLVVAKNQNAFIFLKNQFLRRTVIKKYLALVEGIPAQKTGAIEYPIRPSKYNRLKKVAVKKSGTPMKKSTRLAKTHYRLLKTFGDKFALLEVTPLTGRTHQIRVHLSAIGHPIVGDKLYGSKTQIHADQNADQRGKPIIKRQFLHAFYLKFTAPNGTPLALEADLPEDLKKVLASPAVNISN